MTYSETKSNYCCVELYAWQQVTSCIVGVFDCPNSNHSTINSSMHDNFPCSGEVCKCVVQDCQLARCNGRHVRTYVRSWTCLEWCLWTYSDSHSEPLACEVAEDEAFQLKML